MKSVRFLCQCLLAMNFATNVAAADIGSAVARYTASGELDGTFGTGGRVVSNPAGANFTRAVRADPSNVDRSFVAGSIFSASGDLGILGRYATNGSADTTFGFQGITLADFSSTTAEYISAVGFQSNGKIVIAGNASDINNFFSRWYVARFNANGSLDTTFGTNGFTTSFLGFSGTGAHDMVIDASDRIVVAGTSSTHCALARFTPQGVVDASFGSGGQVLVDNPPPGDPRPTCLTFDAVATSGTSIVAAGLSFANGANTTMGVMRFTSLGAVDTAYGSGGTVMPDFPNATSENARDVVCATGKGCFVVGDTGGESSAFAVVNLTDTGAVNSTFGFRTTTFPGRVSAVRAEMSGGNRLTVVGTAEGTEGLGRFALARYRLTGALDGNFGSGGKVITAFNGLDLRAADVAIDPTSGKVTVVGDSL